MNGYFRHGFEKQAGVKKVIEKVRKALTGKMFPKAKPMKDISKDWEALRKAEKSQKRVKTAAPFTSASRSAVRSVSTNAMKGMKPSDLTKYKIRKPKLPKPVRRVGGVYGPKAFK